MEKAIKDEQLKRVRSELTHGRDLARRLRSHIKNGSSSSQESIRLFIDGLVNSCNMSISMLTSTELPKHQSFPGMPPKSIRPRSIRDNFVHEDADHVPDAQNNNSTSGKRKCVKRGVQVTLAEGAGLETALEDGYSWRKYGQKDILGSKYPRGYYRCTHKTTEGCLARKQIQRTDEQGPPVFNITYCGVHTCSHLQQPVSNSQLLSPAPHPSIGIHETPFPEQHPHEANDILRYSGSIMPSDTAHTEPVFPPIIPHMNPQYNHMMRDTISTAFDAGYHPSYTSSRNCFADCFEVGLYQRGALESDVPSWTPGSPNVGLRQQINLDPSYDVFNWDFSC